MKKFYLLFSNNQFIYLVVIFIFGSMSSCSNTYTASFQSSPTKHYGQSEKSLLNIKTSESAPSEVAVNPETQTDSDHEAIHLEVPNELTAGLQGMGITEKRSEKIQKRLDKLNKSMESARTESGSIDTKKLSFAERMVVKKALKKSDKVLAKNNVKEIKDLDDARDVQQMNRNVRIGLILILVGVIAGIFIWPIGAIVGTIGVVFLILGLLDY